MTQGARWLIVAVLLTGGAFAQTVIVDCSKGPVACPQGRICQCAPVVRDVPAIRGKDSISETADLYDIAYATPLCKSFGGEMVGKRCRYTEQVWTCADKSRILLTAEDGKKWCHKPETEPR